VSSREGKAGARQRQRPGGKALSTGRVSEVQRARMVMAARQVVADEGYARMSVERVVARAGVSRKTFYDLFENREDCFLEAFDDAIARAGRIVGEAYRGERGWREQIRAGLAALLALLDEEPELRAVCVVEALAAGPRVLERRSRVLRVLIDAVERGRELRRRDDPPPLTGEGVVGAVFSVVHARALHDGSAPLSELLGQLMGMIVLPYLGSGAATKELRLPTPPRLTSPAPRRARDVLEGLDMRLTYRTLRVLAVIAEHAGASNRQIADEAGVADQGQVSKLLTRLANLGLIHNLGGGHAKGGPNAWRLTVKGEAVESAIRTDATTAG
jgi:AcrR family transcriptional regulator